MYIVNLHISTMWLVGIKIISSDPFFLFISVNRGRDTDRQRSKLFRRKWAAKSCLRHGSRRMIPLHVATFTSPPTSPFSFHFYSLSFSHSLSLSSYLSVRLPACLSLYTLPYLFSRFLYSILLFLELSKSNNNFTEKNYSRD